MLMDKWGLVLCFLFLGFFLKTLKKFWTIHGKDVYLQAKKGLNAMHEECKNMGHHLFY